jgi:tetratricopeptide (TPR) repeat protein
MLVEAGDDEATGLVLAESPGAAFATSAELATPCQSATCSPYSKAFQQAGQRAIEYAAGLSDERRRARRDLAELLALPSTERRRRIADAHTRFRSRSLVELLIEESHSRVRESPEEARELAELAPAILYWMPGDARRAWADRAYARSLAHRANALRVGGDLHTADEVFRELGAFMARKVIDGEELHAEVTSLEASLRTDQRRFDEAEQLLDQAILLSRSCRDENGLAKNLIKRADVQRLNDRHEESAASLVQALTLLDRETDAFLYLCAVGTLCLHNCDTGRFAEAEALLAENAGLIAANADRWLELRIRHLRARIAQGLGHSAEAESLYLSTREGYLEQNLAYDAATASLDLATLYLELGRHSELKRTAQGIQSIFVTRDVHREAFAALLLFERAAAAERVTAETIHGLRRFLERTRSDKRLLAAEPS